MENCRIFFITPQLYPKFIGGIEVFNHYLINELCKEYKICYLTLNSENKQNRAGNPKRIQLKETISSFQLLQEIFYLFKLRKKYDLIFTSFSRTSWYYIITYPILKVFLKKEYIIVIHGGGLMPWKWKYPYKLYFQKAKKIIGVSTIICNEYYKRTGKEIVYLPPLIPFQYALDSKPNIRKKYDLEIEGKIFLYVGSLKSIKRPGIIMDAFGELGKDFLLDNKIQILFAGDGDLREELISHSKGLGLDNFFIFLGNVSRENINEIYKLSDYYIISSDFEGTPITLLEAMFNKLPILASNVSGINNVIDENTGILFNNHDCKSLISAIKKVIFDNEFSRLISENSYKHYKLNFDYNEMIKSYKSFL